MIESKTLEQTIYLSQVGSKQVLNIPEQFEIHSQEVVIRKEGDRIIIEPVKRPSLLALLSTLPDIEDEIPDVDQGLLPLDEVDI